MVIAWIAGAAGLVAFSWVLFFGAPYLPTRRPQQQQVFKLLKLQPGQVFYDLGCGDGRMLRTAAEQGLTAIGYELNPILFMIGVVCSFRYGDKVKIKFGNFWNADISDANGVFVFLLDKYMPKLDRFMMNQNFTHKAKLVSYAFKIPGKRAKKLGATYLYEY